MADISKITLPSGTEYNIKDAYARQQIAALVGGDAVIFVGVSTTELTDGGNEIPTVSGEQKTPGPGQLFFYGTQEFIYGNDDKWHALGSLDSLGDLAYQDTASSSYTPQGTVAAPTLTVTTTNTTVNSITDVGTLPTCTLPELTTSVVNENLTLSWTDGTFTAGTLPTKGSDTTVATGIDTATATAPTFTGTQATITVS